MLVTWPLSFIQATHLQLQIWMHVNVHPSDTHAYLYQRIPRRSCNKAVRLSISFIMSDVGCLLSEKGEHVSPSPKHQGKRAEKQESTRAGKQKSRIASAHVAPPFRMSTQIDRARLQLERVRHHWLGLQTPTISTKII